MKGEDNLYDALTIHVDQMMIGLHTDRTRQEITEGIHELAPEADGWR